MRLGTQTGSFINHVLSAPQPITPIAGMGATLLLWTDRHAYTVVAVALNGKSLLATRDIAKRSDTNGMSDAQSYTYETDLNATRELFTLRRNGRWVKQGNKQSGECLALGARREYHDFSF